MIKVETYGFESLAATSRKWTPELEKNLKQALEVSLRNIKDDARAGASKFGGRARGVDKTIDYDFDGRFVNGVAGEVGYRRGMPKAGLPLEIGTRFTRPRPVLREAMEKNQEDFFKGVGKAVEATLK